MLSRERLRAGFAQAILVNAGNANACTGPEGLEAARETTLGVARTAEDPGTPGLPASTGVIGQPFPLATHHPGAAQTGGPAQPPGFAGGRRGHHDHRHPAQDLFSPAQD